VPASVHVVLTARIDRLLPMEKRLLQAASVIGKDVSFPLLQAVVGMSEQEIHGGLAPSASRRLPIRGPVAPELEYTFKHALTRDVAYQSLLLEDRRTLHRRVGEAIERCTPTTSASSQKRSQFISSREKNWHRQRVLP